jgi:small conductance mechanosensitive channel
MGESLGTLDRLSDTAMDMAVRFAPKVLAALVILVAGYLAGRWAGRFVGRAVARLHLDPPVRTLLQRVVHLLVIGLFLIVALQNLGIELLPLIAGLGVAGAGIALAMQGVLSNVAAGLTIIFTRPFRVGEYISIVGNEGEVLEVSLFNTILGHADKSKVVIPNRKIAGEILHNYGNIRQLSLEITIAYDADVRAALAAVQEVVAGSARVLKEPAAGTGVARFSETGVVLGAWPWVAASDYVELPGELNEAILASLHARRIAIAVPQREIRSVATAGLRTDAAGRSAA